MADGPQFETYSTRVVRAMESRTIAKREGEGWELVSRSDLPLMRSELVFRRPKKAVPRWAWAVTGVASVAIVVVFAIGALGEREDDPTVASGSAEPTASAAPAAVASEVSAAPSISDEPAPVAPTERPPLTMVNSPELAALLTGSDSDWDGFVEFADDYQGQVIEFDAYIGAMNNHGSYDTRYDILVIAGDPEATSGPAFQFRDVNMSDLNLVGDVPDTIGVHDRLHVVAQIDEYVERQSLMLLDPVETAVR